MQNMHRRTFQVLIGSLVTYEAFLEVYDEAKFQVLIGSLVTFFLFGPFSAFSSFKSL